MGSSPVFHSDGSFWAVGDSAGSGVSPASRRVDRAGPSGGSPRLGGMSPFGREPLPSRARARTRVQAVTSGDRLGLAQRGPFLGGEAPVLQDLVGVLPGEGGGPFQRGRCAREAGGGGRLDHPVAL